MTRVKLCPKVIKCGLSRAFTNTFDKDVSWCRVTSRKLKQDLSLREPKPNIVTQQCVVYLFKCDLCDASYVGYTKGHLHTRVEGHRQKASSIYKHCSKEHNTAVPNNFLACFNVLKKCTNKLDCLVNEILCIQELKPALNACTVRSSLC